MPNSTKKKPVNRFIDDAREMGLDTPEGVEEFERAIRKITPPKRKPDHRDSTEQDNQGK